MIATINELFFPIFLFILYLCTVSIFVHHSQKLTSLDSEVSKALSHTNYAIAIDDTSLEEQQIAESTQEAPNIIDREKIALEGTIPDVKDQETIGSHQSNDLYIQTERIINNLSKRQSRKICKPLGIQQKRGKIEKSLTFIKAEIRSLFKENPERVIAVIQEQLPEVISTPYQVSPIGERVAS